MRTHKLHLLLFFALILSGCVGGSNSKTSYSIDAVKAQQEVNAVLDRYKLLQRAMYLPNILTRDETLDIIGRTVYFS